MRFGTVNEFLWQPTVAEHFSAEKIAMKIREHVIKYDVSSKAVKRYLGLTYLSPRLALYGYNLKMGAMANVSCSFSGVIFDIDFARGFPG